MTSSGSDAVMAWAQLSVFLWFLTMALFVYDTFERAINRWEDRRAVRFELSVRRHPSGRLLVRPYDWRVDG